MSERSTLFVSRLKCLAIEMYKVRQSMSPRFLEDIFLCKNVNYNLRDTNLMILQKYETVTYGFNSLRFQGSKLWNNLDTALKDAATLDSFKTAVGQWQGPSCQMHK